MACTQKYVDYVVEQINNAGQIEGKKCLEGIQCIRMEYYLP